MSTSKFVKIQSQQNGNFDYPNNRVDFRIPASMGNISLKDSFVQLYARTSSDIDETVPIMLQWTAKPDVKFNNVSLIKDAHWTTANKGMVERCRRVDILRDNVLDITRNTTQVMSNSYMDVSQFTPLTTGEKLSIFQQYTKEGSNSQDNADNVPIEIRCGDFLNSWNVDGVVPMDKMGDATLHLELNLDKVSPVSNLEPDFANYVDSKNRNLIEDYTAAANETHDTLTSQATYTSLDSVPFYVGMPINWIYNLAGGGREIRTGKILDLTLADSGKLSITTNNGVAMTAGQQLTDQKVLVRDAGAVTVLVDDYQNTSGGNENRDEVVLTPTYAADGDVPFQNGDSVKWSYAIAGEMSHLLAEVTNVVRDGGSGKATITLSKQVQIADGVTMTDQYLTKLTTGNVSVEYYLAELVVKQENTTSPLKTMVFNQFNTYELNGNNITNYNYTLEIEGDASAVLVMIPDASGLRSSLSSLTDWRLYLNDQNLTDRSEEPFSALSSERLIRTFDTLRMPVRCLTRANYLTSANEMIDEDNNQTIIASPLFFTGGRKNLQMIINSGGLNNYVVFTATPRALEI